MIRYAVVTRSKPQLPIERFLTVEAAGNYIVRERAFHKWTVLAQEANRLEASTPYRALTPIERRKLERTLYPSLFE